MCYPVRCKICSKTTWAGCGEHIEEALAGVPMGERCPGHSDEETAAYRSEHSVFKKMFARQ